MDLSVLAAEANRLAQAHQRQLALALVAAVRSRLAAIKSWLASMPGSLPPVEPSR